MTGPGHTATVWPCWVCKDIRWAIVSCNDSRDSSPYMALC